MSEMASQITSVSIVCSTNYWGTGQRKLRVTGLCAGNSPATDEFPAQKASNAENVSIWWRYYDTRMMQLPQSLHFVIQSKGCDNAQHLLSCVLIQNDERIRSRFTGVYFISVSYLCFHFLLQMRPLVSVVCYRCGRVFNHTGHLNEHIREVHDRIFKYQCHVCQQTFRRPYVLRDHVRHKHPGAAETAMKWKHGCSPLSMLRMTPSALFTNTDISMDN